MQAERCDQFDVHPAGLAVNHLGTNGTARTTVQILATRQLTHLAQLE
jgi:hypothetical protein